MMTYKQALLLLLQRPKHNARPLLLAFTLTALGATTVVFGLSHAAFEMGVPWWILTQQGIPSELLWEMMPLDFIGLSVLGIGLILLLGGLIKSHREVLKVVYILMLKTRHYPNISPEQRLSRLTIAASIVLLSVTLLLLPQVVIVLGGFQTANSSLMLDDAFMPIWVYLVQALFSFVGMYALLLLGVYFRLVFSFSKKV